jgi:hypothetical protein
MSLPSISLYFSYFNSFSNFLDLSKQKNFDIEIETMIVSDNHERGSLMSKFRNRIVQVCHDDDNMLDD